MRKLKVAFIIDEYGIGGTERQLGLLMDGMDQSKFDVSLFFLRNNDGGDGGIGGTKAQVIGVRSLCSLGGMKKIFEFSRLLSKNQFDIVQTFFQDSTLFGILAARLAGIKKIFVSVRDMRFWATPVMSAVHKLVTLLADGVVVNSNAVKESLKGRVFYRKVFVIHNGIEIGDHFRANEASKKWVTHEFNLTDSAPIVVLVANCNRKVKRVDLLIEAIPSVLRSVKAYFLIVGDGHMRPSLEKRVSELGVEIWVRFAGQRHDVEEILSGCDLALNTSDSEGFSNSVMEAMRAGLPVIASDIAGNRELVEDGQNGLFFAPGDPQDLARKISILVFDRELRGKLGVDGCNRIKQEFRIDKMVKKYEEFYLSLMNAPSHESRLNNELLHNRNLNL